MAHPGNGSSLSELENQTESLRAELVQTVDELHSRVSPEVLKQDAKDYARRTSRNVLDTVERKAMENPVATVAIAAGLAIPALRIIASIPVPVLLIGAGLAMTRHGSARRSTNGLASSYQDEPDRHSVGESIAGAASAVGDKARHLVEDVKDKAMDGSSRVKDAVTEQAEAARDMARDMASEAAASVLQAGANLTGKTSRAIGRTQDEFLQAIERQPLLIGGIALALGGLLASVLPKSIPEDRLIGEVSDRLKEKSRDVAAEGVSAVQSAAGDVIDSTADHVRDEGLTPEVARHAVRNALDQASTVLDKAVSSAGQGQSFSLRQG